MQIRWQATRWNFKYPLVEWQNFTLGCYSTCPDTYAPSHLEVATKKAGAVADRAEQLKCTKYTAFQSRYDFVPVGIETSGVFGPSASSFLLELGRRLKLSTIWSLKFAVICFRDFQWQSKGPI